MKRTDLKEADVSVLEPAEQTVDDRSNVLEFSATLRELKKHVDPNLVKQREGWRDRNGNVQMVDYVEWHTVADILDEAAPNWAHTVKDIRQIGDLMTVTVAITTTPSRSRPFRPAASAPETANTPTPMKSIRWSTGIL